MLTAIEITVHAIGAVVQTVPMGTNIALVHILWVMMSGGFAEPRCVLYGAQRQGVRHAGSAPELGGDAHRRMGCQRTARQLATLCGE